MKKKDYCRMVDVFYGNGEVDHFATDGLASKWFYIKALCGNTVPHPVLPFGKMSVGAYSGGFPTGYGTHYPAGCGKIKKLFEVNKARGFSHLHQSGTGGIGFYYNYAIVTPFYGNVKSIENYYELSEEAAVPGYYSAVLNDVRCQLTVNNTTAYHRYNFNKDGGRVAVDFSNDGLSRLFKERYYGYVKNAEVKLHSDNTVLFSGILSGIKLYFCVKAEGANVTTSLFGDIGGDGSVNNSVEKFGAVFDFAGDEVLIKLSYSTVSYEKAMENVEGSQKSFEETKNDAYNVWNEYLSAIDIDTPDEEFKKLFYSNFYHSIIKPIDMTGEEILGIKGAVAADFATFWDQYKTLLPLIFTLYPEMSKKITDGIKNISRTFKKIPCNLGLSDRFVCEEQAKMLGIYALCDAYYAGIPGADAAAISECIKRELEREDYKIFLKSGLFERYTHILDVTDACLDAAEITRDCELKEYLLKLAENWKNAYDADGLMSVTSPYYEGDRYTYSFRLQKNMPERIELAGGKDRYAELLDTFFGFNGDSIDQLAHLEPEDIEKTNYHRFQGFNNECDMEAPYAYIFTGGHNRTCDIIHEALTKSFVPGKGGLPGNNDSGGLSSCFIWNALGLFPVSGAGIFLIGTPHIKKAVLKLSNGKNLTIEADNLSDKNYYVESVKFNGEPIENYIVKTQELMQGGKIVFNMKKSEIH